MVTAETKVRKHAMAEATSRIPGFIVEWSRKVMGKKEARLQ